MAEQIGVILFEECRDADTIAQGISSQQGLRLVARVGSLSALREAERGVFLCSKAEYAQPPQVVICFFCPDEKLPSPDVLAYIRDARLKSIVVAGSAVKGFEMLRYGVSEMLVFRSDNAAFFYKALAVRCRAVFFGEGSGRVLKRDFGGQKVQVAVAIGASTGGTDSIVKVLEHFPEDMPPVLVTQHMPPVFTGLFSKRLSGLCKMSVWEAADGDELQNGLVLIAPGDRQMLVERRAGRLVVNCTNEARISGHCPSVDALFSSLAESLADRAIGVILTGMGADGAQGLLDMRRAGAYTIGQDEASSVIYGMPKAAYDIGAVCTQLNLDSIAGAILAHIATRK